MPYVDGFVIPVPKKKLGAYVRMAQKAGKVWREHGALEYRECAGDDLKIQIRDSVSPVSESKAWGDGDFFVDPVQVPSASRSCKCEGHEGSTHHGDVRFAVDAVRRQTHGVWRIQGLGCELNGC